MSSMIKRQDGMTRPFGLQKRTYSVPTVVRRLIHVFFAHIVIAAWFSPAYADAGLYFDDKSGLFEVRYNTAPVASGSFAFWRGDWSWFDFGIRTEAARPSGHTLSGSVDGGARLEGTVVKSSASELTWTLKIDPGSIHDLYGGMSFNLSPTDPATADADVRLLPDRAGWEFTYASGQPSLRVTFDPAPKQLHLERGSTREIRAYFIEKGERADRSVRMTVSLQNAGKVEATDAERLAKPDASWHRQVVGWNQTPIDLGFLNDRPAGKNGPVKVVGEKLVFEDGSSTRFWGTNVTSFALFQTPELMVPRQAKRLAALGFNLVRLHHHDSEWVGFNVFGKEDEYTGKISELAMNKLDWWIKCLKDEGIYVWLDLHTGRAFGKADNIRDFDEIAKGKNRATAAGFTYLNPDLQDRMKDFNTGYLGHVNPHTGLTYAQEPAVVGILITNENDLSFHYGNGFLPDYNVPKHTKIFMKAADDFAALTNLDRGEIWKTWMPGPSKFLLNDLEHVFNRTMIANVRQTGASAPLVTTNSWGEMGLASLPSLTDGDVIDVHTYGKPNDVESDPRFVATLPSWIGAAAVAGKPVSVTEWNVSPFPAFDRSMSAPYLAAIASLQDWAALMQFAYANSDLRGGGAVENWTAANDPAVIATLPVAALLYRQGHVSPAKTTYLLDLSAATLMGRDLSPKTSRAIRTITETGKLRIAIPAMPELPWLKPSENPKDAIVITDPNFDAIPAGQSHVCSDTGEVCRNWQTGVFTVDTAQSQIAAGWIGGRRIDLKNVAVDIATPYATIALQSLDGQQIDQSRRLLVTFTAQSTPEVPGRLPFVSEPVEGTLKIKAQTGLKAYAVGGDGSRENLELLYADGSYTLALSDRISTFWMMLEAE